jgi:ATP-binding cassette subfamily F protein uup
MKNPNFLILDEPTNDLDIISQNVLEEFLEEYPGCLVVVSHDRHFMRKITDHLLVFEGNGTVIDFPGTYYDYLLWKDQRNSSEKISLPPHTMEAVFEPPIMKPKLKRTYKEQREFEQLEIEISDLESRKNELTQSLQRPSTPFTEITKLSQELTEVMRLLDEKSTRWLQLADINLI